MRTLKNKECIGICWNHEGACFGVKVSGNNERYEVTSAWRSSSESEEDVSVLLSKGIDDLAPVDNTKIIAGSTALEAGVLDLTIPDLNSADLRSLLAYELRKQSPVAEANLVWGYRKLPTANKSADKNNIRLIFMREEAWYRWVDHISSIPNGIDALLPPFAALDPPLQGSSVMLSGNGDRPYVMAADTTSGLRSMLFVGEEQIDAFGAPPDPLSHATIDEGPLLDYPEAEQQNFTGPLILALYGASGAVREDRKTSLALPVELRRRPHKASFRLGAFLVLYFAVVLLFAGMKSYLNAGAYLDELKKEIRQTEYDIEKLADKDTPRETLQAVQQEVSALQMGEASLTECLIEITKLLDDKYWVANMSWNEGRIQLEIRTNVDDLSLVDKLEKSPILADVVPVRKVVDHKNNLIMKIQLHTAIPESEDVQPVPAPEL
ncbi:MAG: hypothetical protein R6V56_03725 [Lentisphaeria bacterium]